VATDTSKGRNEMAITIGNPQLQIERLPDGKYRSYIKLKFLLNGVVLGLPHYHHPIYFLEKSDLVFQHYSYSPKFEKVPDDLIDDITWRIEKNIAMKFDEDMYGVKVIRGKELSPNQYNVRIKNKRKVPGLQVDYSVTFPKSFF
jgi:hypothetical protein